MEQTAITNAAANPEIVPRSIIKNLSEQVAVEGLPATSSMSRISSLSQKIYRSRYTYFLLGNKYNKSSVIIISSILISMTSNVIEGQFYVLCTPERESKIFGKSPKQRNKK